MGATSKGCYIMTRQVIAHTDLYNDLCLFSRRAQAHAKTRAPAREFYN